MSRTSIHAQRERIERAIELYLQDCYAQKTAARVSELAHRLGTNRAYLSRIVPAALGMSLREAMRRRQLEYAAHLLRTSPLSSVAEIAILAAFGHPSTFYRLFRNAFGLSPDEHRRQVTKCEER